MFRVKHITLAVAAALAANSAMAAQGPSSSAGSYLLGLNPSTTFTSILTTGDKVGGYMMAGIPDGLGAYDNNDGTFTVLMNHELGSGVGVARGPLTKGAFVSEWVINKTTLQVTHGADLIQNVYGWNAGTQSSNTTPTTGWSFNRFCSADLAKPSAFYNAQTGLGSQERIFLNGEEGGATGYALAHVATGASKGSTYVLGKMNPSTNGNTSGATGVGGWENLLANPYTGNKTVVIGNNDGGTGVLTNALSLYVGTKQATGTEVDKAGLTNGTTKFINVTGFTTEFANGGNTTTRQTAMNGAHFTLSDTASTTFSRPEDGAWSNDGSKYYFVTTDQLDKTDTGVAASSANTGGTRLWSLSFDALAIANGTFDSGTVNVEFDSTTIPNGLGNARPNMWDNISVNADGTLTLLEDTGGANHNGKVWTYDPSTHQMTMSAKFDPTLFGDLSATGAFTAGTHTNDEETSGVIDITALLGRNDGKQYRLLVAQDHALSSVAALNIPVADQAAAVEGGQLILMAVPEPETYAMMIAGLGLMGFAARRSNKK